MILAACIMGNVDLRLICSRTSCLVRSYPPISHVQTQAVMLWRVQLKKCGAVFVLFPGCTLSICSMYKLMGKQSLL